MVERGSCKREREREREEEEEEEEEEEIKRGKESLRGVTTITGGGANENQKREIESIWKSVRNRRERKE